MFLSIVFYMYEIIYVKSNTLDYKKILPTYLMIIKSE